MGKNLELKIAFDVCVNYCNKHSCNNCYWTDIPCPLLAIQSKIETMRDSILKNMGIFE